MPNTLTDMDGSADLEFEVSLPDVPIEQVEMNVQMGQQGTSVELRDKEKALLLRLDGHQLDHLHRDGRINVSRPDTMRQSVYNYWLSQRKPPEAPTAFRFVVKSDDSVESMIGKVKLLLDFLTERQELACHVRQVSRPMSVPEQPKEPEQKTSPVSPEKPKAPKTDEKKSASPPDSKPASGPALSPQKNEETSREGRPPQVR